MRSGPIELQTHGGEIRWRNIWLKELTPEEANESLQQHEGQAFYPLFNGGTWRVGKGAWKTMTSSMARFVARKEKGECC